jgi:hypothetical protein
MVPLSLPSPTIQPYALDFTTADAPDIAEKAASQHDITPIGVVEAPLQVSEPRLHSSSNLPSDWQYRT